MLRDVSSDEWDAQVMKSKEPVAVEFWAPWCPWCRRLTPEFESLSVEYEGRLSVFKLNSDDYPDIAQRYGVMGLPTIKLFCQGRAIGEIVGYVPRPRLKAELERALQNRRECLSNSSPVRF
jgi:thioredoxin 1